MGAQGAVQILHRRASAWYAANGMPAEAIRHALAAQDFGRAADLVEHQEMPAVPRRAMKIAFMVGPFPALCERAGIAR